LEAEKRTEALVDVMRESGVTAKKGVLSLPLSMSFITTVQLEHIEGQDMDARVQVEARKYIPIPLKDVSLEWTILPEIKNQEATEEVLIAAVENNAYQGMNALLNSVGLTSQPTEIELFCAQRAVANPATTHAILDLGAATTKVYIVHEGIIYKIHRVFSGGQLVTAEFAKQLQLEPEGAENIKRSSDMTEPQQAALQSIYSNLYQRSFQEVRRVIQGFEQQTGTEIEQVVLTGGVAASLHVQQLLRDRLEKECVVINGFSNVAYPAFVEDTLKDIAPSFSVALGAALRQVQ
jgi:type IV pilus assembly protein PilM